MTAETARPTPARWLFLTCLCGAMTAAACASPAGPGPGAGALPSSARTTSSAMNATSSASPAVAALELPPLGALPVAPDAGQAACGPDSAGKVIEAIGRHDEASVQTAAACPDGLAALVEARFRELDVPARLVAIRAVAAQNGASAWHALLFALESPGLDDGCAMPRCHVAIEAARALEGLRHAPPPERVLHVAVRQRDPAARSVLYRVAGRSGNRSAIARLAAAAAWEASFRDPQEDPTRRAVEGEPAVWIEAALVKLGDEEARRRLLSRAIALGDLRQLEYIGEARLLRLALPILDSDARVVLEVGSHVAPVETRARDYVIALAGKLGLVKLPAATSFFPRYDDALAAETKRAILALPAP